MEHDPKTPQYTTADKNSFGYITARDRWPVIITQVIDDAYRSITNSEGEKLHEGKEIMKDLTSMKYELQHNRKLSPLKDDGQADISLYNKELKQLGNPNWFNMPWLFAECYLYRRIQTYFGLSTHWKCYDVFARQKIRAFRSSRAAVMELASHYKTLVSQMASRKGKCDVEAQRLLAFREMCEICLWGNATDLSLLTSLSQDDMQKLQGSDARKASEKNVLVDHLDAAYAVLKSAKHDSRRKERKIDMVLDNAGFELYVDLALAGYLVEADLATTVVLHVKKIPWFVSDVIPADFAALLSALASPKPFYETPSEEEKLQCRTPKPMDDAEMDDLGFLFQNLAAHHADGRLVLRPNPFWNHPGSFWRMPAEAPELVEDLQAGVLSVWKGDLNYRKLTADAAWEPTTAFTKAIGPLGPGSGINILSLRTCKSDVVVGLMEGEDERLRALEGEGGDSKQRKWAWNGKWALCSFSSGSQTKS